MPCWEVNKITVDWKGVDVELLRKAADGLGLSMIRTNGSVSIGPVKISLKAGTVRGREGEINRVKRAYSRAAVKRATKRQGWTVKEKEGKRNKLILRRW